MIWGGSRCSGSGCSFHSQLPKQGVKSSTPHWLDHTQIGTMGKDVCSSLGWNSKRTENPQKARKGGGSNRSLRSSREWKANSKLSADRQIQSDAIFCWEHIWLPAGRANHLECRAVASLRPSAWGFKQAWDRGILTSISSEDRRMLGWPHSRRRKLRNIPCA